MSENKLGCLISFAGAFFLAGTCYAAPAQLSANKAITKSDCTSEKLGATISERL